MDRRTVLAAIGDDRPGLVEEVSEFIRVRGGSIEDSRMANMDGQFALVALVGGSPEAIDRIAADLESMSAKSGLYARLAPANTRAASPARVPYRLQGSALDQPGLVHEVASMLRSLDVNIESMDTSLEAAPITGAPVFAMDITIAVPQNLAIAQVRAELARVCDLLNIDWHLAPL